MGKIYRFIAMSLYSLRFLVKSLLLFLKHTFYGEVMKLEDDEKKNEVIIMGNGPSLKDLHFNRIDRNNYKVCCVNYYPAKEKEFWRIKPDFLCLIDPAFFDYVVESKIEDYNKLLRVLESVDWNLKIIAPYGKKMNVKNDNISYVWVNTNQPVKDIFCWEKWWLFNNNMANPGMQNVILGALYFFLASNSKKIYVTGVDFSEFKYLYVDEDNRVYVDTIHSYGSQRHYFDELPIKGFTEFHVILEAYRKMFFEAYKIRQYADYKDIEIINLSVQSYIDSFRKESPTVLEKCDR